MSLSTNHQKTAGLSVTHANKIPSSQKHTISQDITTLFNELKIRRKNRYLIFKLASDGTGIVEVEFIGERKETAKDFINRLPNSDCRFAIYDHEYTSADNRKLSKLLFVSWLPDNSHPHSVMSYTAAQNVFKESFTGVFDFVGKTIEEVEVATGLRAEGEDVEEDEGGYESD